MTCAALALSTTARAAAPAAPTSDRATSTSTEDRNYHERYWIVDPRPRPASPEPDLLKMEIHGEYLLHLSAVPSPRLAQYGFSDYADSLGQTHRLAHRMRFTPRLFYRDALAIVAQFDAPYGTVLGESPDHVEARGDQAATVAQPMRVALRWAYAEVRVGAGHLRLGQQPAHWGSGLVLNSGDERQFLGDSRFGTIVERLGYEGRPWGANSSFELIVATDWVVSDTKVQWLDGDHSMRSLIGASLQAGPDRRVGLMLMGENLRPKSGHAVVDARAPSEMTATIDLAGKYAFAVPGRHAFVMLAAEAAAVLGTSDVSPEILLPSNARVARFGALGQLGVTAVRGSGRHSWANWGLMLEWGYMSGDSNPGDGTDRRFIANPSRRVGLVLFDEVLRWKAARAAAASSDPRLGMRPSASSYSIATNGGVAGATYLILQGLFRPIPNFDLRTAALVAQATSDGIDPVQLVTHGRWTNFDGGAPAHRDLGLELDFAAEFRQPLDHGISVMAGVEGGVLFPGRALADAQENTVGRQQLVRGRLGFYF
ncbi:MAG TPA: hypothetical protein VKP30_25195 [Polyangiaceae bacterium]|nr:hypothetical protein [Polyangiaceae bacterium]